MTSPSIYDDILRSKSGDTVAYGRIVRATRSYALRLAYRLLGRKEEAEDIAQEAFIRIWNNLSRFDHQKKFTTWLYTIVSNLCMDRLRARQREEARFERMNPGSADAASADVVDLSAKELAEIVVSIARRLPPQQRLVFTLRDIEDLSVGEVEAITRLPARIVKANLYYARRAVRELLRSEFHITGI